LSLEESEAMVAMLADRTDGSIEFVTSAVALEELQRIPDEHKLPHLTIYHLLGKVRALSEPSLTRLGLTGGPAANPDRRIWSRAHEILPDKEDAQHLYQVIRHQVPFLVTVDAKTILKHKLIIQKEIGVHCCKPSELIEFCDNERRDS
jgi:hypothetical protein